MEYTTSLKLDMNPRGAPPVVRVKQGDGFSRFLQAQLTKDGVNFTPESGITYLFRCQKPDGHAVIEDSVSLDAELDRYLIVNQGSGVIQIELVDQVATAAGRCLCDLCMFKDEKILSTIPFVIEVVASPDVGTLAVSTDDFRTLVNLIEEVEEILDILIEEVFTEITTLTLPRTGWTGASSPYAQTVTILGATITGDTRVDLCGDATAVGIMTRSGTLEIMISNTNGTLTAYAFGQKPDADLSLQAALVTTKEI